MLATGYKTDTAESAPDEALCVGLTSGEHQSSAVARGVRSAPLAGLRVGDDVDGVYACVRKDRLQTKAGAPYLAVEIRDRTASLAARAFRNADLLAGGFERGDLVSVKGQVERFRGELQLALTSIRRSERGEPSEFLPTAYRDRDELDGFLEHLANEIYDRDYRLIVERMLGDEILRARWREAPCTQSGHHAYLGGLLEHTVAVATLVSELVTLHPRLNPDLLLTAAIVHDIGKTQAFTLGASIELSDQGKLVGHLMLGQQIVDSYSNGIEESRRLALSHCILGHHGAQVLPTRRFESAEALALYRLNALDSGVKEFLEVGARELV